MYAGAKTTLPGAHAGISVPGGTSARRSLRAPIHLTDQLLARPHLPTTLEPVSGGLVLLTTAAPLATSSLSIPPSSCFAVVDARLPSLKDTMGGVPWRWRAVLPPAKGTRRARLRLVIAVAAVTILLWAVHAFLHGTPDAADYRRHLDEFHSADAHDIRPNLGFDHVYVVSLARRDDRRKVMSKLAAAHNLRLTFIDALPFETSVVGWIAERVAEVRRMKRGLLGKGLQLPQNSLGGQDIDSCWLIPSVSLSPAPHLQLLVDPFYPNLDGLDLPSLSDDRFDGQDWVAHLNAKMSQDRLDDLKPSQRDVNVTKIMHDPVEKFINRQTNEGTIACWHSHMQAVQTIIDNEDKRALILEDDVDFEWDLERTWAAIARWLPERGERRRSAYDAATEGNAPPTVRVESYDKDGEEQWHSVFLGHCWGRESERETVPAGPRCYRR